MAAAAEGCVPLWIYSFAADRIRMPEIRRSISHASVYSEFVRSALVRQRQFRPAELTEASTPAEWARSLEPLNCMALGVMLCRPFWSPTSANVLSPRQVFFHDFWRELGAGSTLAFVDIVEAVLLQAPTQVFQHLAGNRPTGTFFKLSEVSKQRALSAVTTIGVQARDVIARWERDYYGGLPFQNGARIACTLFTSFAVLCATSIWDGFAFPFYTGRRGAGKGLHLVRPLCGRLQAPEDADPDACEVLTPDLLLNASNLLRTLFPQNAAHRHELTAHIDWMWKLRNAMVHKSHMRGAKAYEMVHLVHCVSLAGYGRDPHKLKDMCRLALRATVPDREVRTFYEDLLAQPHVIPSSSSLYRHRLTLHLGYCRMLAARTADLLAQDEEIVRWGTIDSSTQGNHELVYSGASMMRAQDLIPRLRDALELIHLAQAAEPDGHALQRMPVLTAALERDLKLVAAVPTGVGSGCASMLHKLHAVCHSLRLTSQSWSSTATLLSSTCTWTGDLGTESGFCRHRGSMLALFGGWVQASDRRTAGLEPNGEFEFVQDARPFAEADAGGRQLEVDEDDEFQFGAPHEHVAEQQQQRDYPDPVDDYEINCQASIFVAGVLHIVSNITKDLSVALEGFKEFVSELKEICRMLSRHWSRRRFVATCLTSQAGRAHVDEFSGFSEHVHEGRWGTVLSACTALLVVGPALRAFWSVQAYNAGRADRAEADDEAGGGGQASIKADVVDRAITSAKFWAYAGMVDRTGECLEHLSNFAESCPCHRKRARLFGHPRRAERRRHFQHETAKATCPLSTRMAPELAAGEHLTIIRGLCTLSETSLLQDPGVTCLPQVDRSLVLQDFARAKRHILFNLELKLGFWRTLPWALFAIAHGDADVARQCAQRALQMYAASLDANHHWVSTLLCHPGGEGHAEMVRFASGAANLVDLPVVGRMAARFRFAPCVERWVEGRHAQALAHLRATRHASVVHIAFSGLRMKSRNESRLVSNRIGTLEHA